MKRPGKSVFIFIVIFILVFAFVSFFGVNITLPNGAELKLVKGVEDINKGTDIMGGVSVSYVPADPATVDEKEMIAARDVVRNRLIAYGIIDYELYVDVSSKRIILSFPWQLGAEESAAETTVSKLAKRAQFMIVEGKPKDVSIRVFDENGNLVSVEDSDGNSFPVVITREDVSYVSSMTNSYGDKALIFTFTEEGKDLFAQANARNMNSDLTFWLDDACLDTYFVDHILTSGRAVIGRTNGFSSERAQNICDYVNSGEIPFELTTRDYEVMQATLGDKALEAMIVAGILAFIAICVFMILRYRLLGVVACFSLLGLVAVVIAVVSGFFPFVESFTLTFPGIAGIILSLGMGVDASIIMGERIKDEIIKGKSIEVSIETGIQNSFSSVLDSNVILTVIAIILIGIFGPPGTVWNYILYPVVFFLPDTTTGSIYAFGYTLLAGVAGNFFMGTFASRLMLLSLSQFKIFNKRSYFGGEKE